MKLLILLALLPFLSCSKDGVGKGNCWECSYQIQQGVNSYAAKQVCDNGEDYIDFSAGGRNYRVIFSSNPDFPPIFTDLNGNLSSSCTK